MVTDITTSDIDSLPVPQTGGPAAAPVGKRPGAPMRIVHLLKHCGYANGNVHVAIDLACMQARAGDQVTVVSSGGTFVPLLEQYGVTHLTIPHEQNRPLDMVRAAWKVLRLASKQRPDVLHAHMMSSALIAYFASRLSGVPLVTTVHNSFDKHSSIMKLADVVVAVSHAEGRALVRKGYDPERVVAVMNAPDGSPRDSFMKNPHEIVLEHPCILAANALHRRKGVFDLIDACAVLFKEMPEWRLYIAGEGPDSEELQQQAKDLGLAARIHFLGFVPAPRPLMQQTDIFVLASYADPCSLGIGEARAAGCAIVASKVGGTPEMLSYGRTGRLFTPGHVPGLIAELRRLMENDQRREALRAASLSNAEVFHVSRLLKDYAKVYRMANEKRTLAAQSEVHQAS